MKHKHNTYEAQTWPLAKTVTTKKIKLPLNKEVYTQTMLMARHQKIAKLFDEDFWVKQWRSQEKDGVYVVPLDAWKIKNRRRQIFGMGHNLKTSTKTKDKFIQESQIINDYKKTTRKVLQIAKKSINLPWWLSPVGCMILFRGLKN